MKRLIVDGVLAFQAPLAIGGLKPTPGSDRPILLDQRGQPAVPGTAIAGALRNLLARLLPHVPPSERWCRDGCFPERRLATGRGPVACE